MTRGFWSSDGLTRQASGLWPATRLGKNTGQWKVKTAHQVILIRCIHIYTRGVMQ